MLLLSSRPGTALKLDIPIMRWHLRKSDFMRIMKTRKMAEEKVNFFSRLFSCRPAVGDIRCLAFHRHIVCK